MRTKTINLECEGEVGETDVVIVRVYEMSGPMWREVNIQVVVPLVPGEGWSDVEQDAMDAALDQAAKDWGMTETEGFDALDCEI